MLMIDGLDEIKSDSREAMLNKAIEYANALKCGLVVTSRKIDIVKRETFGFEKRELLPFEFAQAFDMMKNCKSIMSK